MLHPVGIELSNICNLSCKYCTTPTTRYTKGFVSRENVALAINYALPNSEFELCGLGEPLLCKDLLLYVNMAYNKGLKPNFSTNGILLTKALFLELLKAGLYQMKISLHTLKSVESFIMVAEYLIKNKIDRDRFRFWANFLEGQIEAEKWLDSLDVSSELRQYIRRIPAHNFAGNVPGKRIAYSNEVRTRRMGNCFYLKENRCFISWDGTVRTCCFDSENVNAIGDLRDFPKLIHMPDNYKLCTFCDPNWANGELKVVQYETR